MHLIRAMNAIDAMRVRDGSERAILSQRYMERPKKGKLDTDVEGSLRNRKECGGKSDESPLSPSVGVG